MRAEITKRIKALGQSGRPREAVSELAQMARLGVQPDTQAGTALLHACVRNGQIDMAQTVFEELFGTASPAGCDAHFHVARLHHATWQDLTCTIVRCSGALLQPDDITFSILLKGYGDCIPPRWVAISSLLHMMDQKFNMQPSTGTQNA